MKKDPKSYKDAKILKFPSPTTEKIYDTEAWETRTKTLNRRLIIVNVIGLITLVSLLIWRAG